MRILHLEDNPSDGELLRGDLTAAWPECEVKRVATRMDFVAQLAVGGHDIILSDFNLVGFNGLDALRLAQEASRDVPFIFFSGSIGEDCAVEALRAGASDYVLKDRPKRLMPAISRALDEARHRRERRTADERLLRAQRMENIGMLAAGIAHDFNNVLAPVLMAVPLLRAKLGDPVDQNILSNVECSVRRGASLVRQILGFAHGIAGEPQIIQPKHLLRELLGVVRQTFPQAVKIDDDIPCDLWPLKVNPTQLHQVLLNLCVNARDAMPGGGTLSVRAGNRAFDEATAAEVRGVKPGPYLFFEIVDNGTGIPPDVLDRIWEPFFTTKDPAHGTGLGLSTARSIVERHQGVIAVQSSVGHGTTFQVFFPAMPETQPTRDLPDAAAMPSGRGELILVTDDDEGVRATASVILSRHGYRVLTAASGTEAVALFAPRSMEIQVVITDLDMPELDGVALIRVIRSLNPATQVLLMSGADRPGDSLRHEPVDSRMLSKPFSAVALLTAVNDLLSGSPPSSAESTAPPR